VHEGDSGEIVAELAERVHSAADQALREDLSVAKIERAIRRTAGGFVSERTRRRPMIMPVVLEA